MTIPYTALGSHPHTVVGELLVTAGHAQIVVTHCPRCGSAHRHLGVGIRRSPCGLTYVVTLGTAEPILRAA